MVTSICSFVSFVPVSRGERTGGKWRGDSGSYDAGFTFFFRFRNVDGASSVAFISAEMVAAVKSLNRVHSPRSPHPITLYSYSRFPVEPELVEQVSAEENTRKNKMRENKEPSRFVSGGNGKRRRVGMPSDQGLTRRRGEETSRTCPEGRQSMHGMLTRGGEW